MAISRGAPRAHPDLACMLGPCTSSRPRPSLQPAHPLPTSMHARIPAHIRMICVSTCVAVRPQLPLPQTVVVGPARDDELGNDCSDCNECGKTLSGCRAYAATGPCERRMEGGREGRREGRKEGGKEGGREEKSLSNGSWQPVCTQPERHPLAGH